MLTIGTVAAGAMILGLVIVVVCLAIAIWVGLNAKEHLDDEQDTVPVAPKFRAGDTIVCPACGQRRAIVKRDVFGNEGISSAAFDGIAYNEDLHTRCFSCLTPCARLVGTGFQLHTQEGWK